MSFYTEETRRKAGKDDLQLNIDCGPSGVLRRAASDCEASDEQTKVTSHSIKAKQA